MRGERRLVISERMDLFLGDCLFQKPRLILDDLCFGFLSAFLLLYFQRPSIHVRGNRGAKQGQDSRSDVNYLPFLQF